MNGEMRKITTPLTLPQYQVFHEQFGESAGALSRSKGNQLDQGALHLPGVWVRAAIKPQRRGKDDYKQIEDMNHAYDCLPQERLHRLAAVAGKFQLRTQRE